jgi:hypothetical protein
MKERFSHDGRQYVLAFRQNQFVVYEEFHHDPFYSWWDDEPPKSKQVKNPIRLVRKIWQVTRQFIYQNKIPYFQIRSDQKRSAIYRRFLDTLSGYQYFEYGYSFAVVKMKGDQ